MRKNELVLLLLLYFWCACAASLKIGITHAAQSCDVATGGGNGPATARAQLLLSQGIEYQNQMIMGNNTFSSSPSLNYDYFYLLFLMESFHFNGCQVY